MIEFEPSIRSKEIQGFIDQVCF